jgi:hypothetical protein
MAKMSKIIQAKTPSEVKTMAVVQTATKPAPKPSTAVAAFLREEAMSKDVGVKVLAGLSKSTLDLQDAEDVLDTAKRKQNGHLGSLMHAFWKAARNDPSIKIGDAFSEQKPLLKDLRQRLEVAVGLKERKVNDDGTVTFVQPKEVQAFFCQPGEDKTTKEGVQKENFRTNFATQFTMCMKSACEAVQGELELKMDDKSGLLVASGKSIKEHYGCDQITLNEQRKGQNKDGTTVKLDKIPSFTGLARLAAARNDKVLQTRTDSRAVVAKTEGGTGTAMPTQNEVHGLANSLRIILSKLNGLEDNVASALTELQKQITETLTKNRGLKEAADAA